MDFEIELKKVEFNEYDEADVEMLYDFIDKIKCLSNKRDAIPAIFNFMEEFHNKELGSPGPLVHFLEEKNDYHRVLKESLSRKPTVVTVWMVNRILNSLNKSEQSEWLSALELASKNELADDIAKDKAKEYLEYQRGEI